MIIEDLGGLFSFKKHGMDVFGGWRGRLGRKALLKAFLKHIEEEPRPEQSSPAETSPFLSELGGSSSTLELGGVTSWRRKPLEPLETKLARRRSSS